MHVLTRCLASWASRSAAHRAARGAGGELGLTLVLLTSSPTAAQVILAWKASVSMMRLLLLALGLLLPSLAWAVPIRTGTPIMVGIGKSNAGRTTVTVPADAQLMVCTTSGYGGAVGYFSGGRITIGGSPMTLVPRGDYSTAYWQGTLGYRISPPTGSQTLAWDWAGTGQATERGGIMCAYYKNLDTASTVWGTSCTQSAGNPHTTATLPAQTGDLAVAFVFQFVDRGTDTTFTWDWEGATFEVTEFTRVGRFADGALAEAAPGGNLTISASGIQEQDGGICGIVVKPAGGEPPPPETEGCPDGQIGTPPNCFPAPPAPAAPGKQWTVVFFEEFNGTTLDTTKLTPCFDWNYGACTASFNAGKERYLPAQVQISNGTAKLVAEPLSPPYANSACYQGQCTYKAGLVSTARPRADDGSPYLFPFTYGYIESRMKFPGTAGFFTAFWMLPTNPSFSYDTEIDIVEILGGYPDTIFMHYHYNGRGASYTPNNGLHNNGACQVKDYSTDFVRFGLDWQPTYIAWYIDGVKCGQFNGNTTTIENGPMQLILHMMIDNQWERDWGSVLSSQTLVRQLEVDYIRIYQQQ